MIAAVVVEAAVKRFVV